MAFLAALAPYAASAASSLLPYASTALASSAPTLAKYGSKLLAHGVKQSVPELLAKVRQLSGTQAGREQILSKVGKLGNIGTRGGAEVLGLLNKANILGKKETARHMENIGKVSGGLQYALGKLSKINKRFG